MDSDEPDLRKRTPTPLLVAAAVVFLEGFGVVVFGAFEALSTTSARVVMGTTTSLFFVVYGAAMVLCAWGLTRRDSWARGPVLISQLIALGLAWNFRSGDTAWISVLLMIPAIVALIGMLHPATIEALNDDER